MGDGKTTNAIFVLCKSYFGDVIEKMSSDLASGNKKGKTANLFGVHTLSRVGLLPPSRLDLSTGCDGTDDGRTELFK